MSKRFSLTVFDKSIHSAFRLSLDTSKTFNFPQLSFIQREERHLLPESVSQDILIYNQLPVLTISDGYLDEADFSPSRCRKFSAMIRLATLWRNSLHIVAWWPSFDWLSCNDRLLCEFPTVLNVLHHSKHRLTDKVVKRHLRNGEKEMKKVNGVDSLETNTGDSNTS